LFRVRFSPRQFSLSRSDPKSKQTPSLWRATSWTAPDMVLPSRLRTSIQDRVASARQPLSTHRLRPAAYRAGRTDCWVRSVFCPEQRQLPERPSGHAPRRVSGQLSCTRRFCAGRLRSAHFAQMKQRPDHQHRSTLPCHRLLPLPDLATPSPGLFSPPPFCWRGGLLTTSPAAAQGISAPQGLQQGASANQDHRLSPGLAERFNLPSRFICREPPTASVGAAGSHGSPTGFSAVPPLQGVGDADRDRQPAALSPPVECLPKRGSRERSSRRRTAGHANAPLRPPKHVGPGHRRIPGPDWLRHGVPVGKQKRSPQRGRRPRLEAQNP